MMTMHDAVIMRTISDMPSEQMTSLDAWCRREGVSRADAVRRAVAALLAEQSSGAASRAFGLWRDRADDADALVEVLRTEWS